MQLLYPIIDNMLTSAYYGYFSHKIIELNQRIIPTFENLNDEKIQVYSELLS